MLFCPVGENYTVSSKKFTEVMASSSNVEIVVVAIAVAKTSIVLDVLLNAWYMLRTVL